MAITAAPSTSRHRTVSSELGYEKSGELCEKCIIATRPVNLLISKKYVNPAALKKERLEGDSHAPQKLPESIAGYLRASLSDSTRTAYRSDLTHFLRWGGCLPASPEMIARYIAEFAGLLSIATLRRRLVSIGKAHSSQNIPSPIDSALVKATFRGICRAHGTAQRQVAPAVKEDILAMVAGISGIKGIRDRALLLVGFAGAFRRSELVSLRCEDVEFVNRGLLVHLRRSKTDQEGLGRAVGIPYARGAVCPVHALQEWLGVSCISEGMIFRRVNRHGQISELAIAPQAVALVVKERALGAGLDPAKYSGHSLRAGLITSAAMAGVSTWKIRAQSGHRTDGMVSRYVRDANIFVDNAAGAVL